MAKILTKGKKQPSPKVEYEELKVLPGVVPLEKGPDYAACIKKRGNSKADKKYCSEQVVKKGIKVKSGRK